MKTLFGSLFGMLFVYCLVTFIIGGLCWPYTIATTLTLLHKPVVQIAFWKGGLLGMVPGIGQLSIPGAGIVWILSTILL